MDSYLMTFQVLKNYAFFSTVHYPAGIINYDSSVFKTSELIIVVKRESNSYDSSHWVAWAALVHNLPMTTHIEKPLTFYISIETLTDNARPVWGRWSKYH